MRFLHEHKAVPADSNPAKGGLRGKNEDREPAARKETARQGAIKVFWNEQEFEVQRVEKPEHKRRGQGRNHQRRR